ncbi:MAG: LysM peptidoglycan-binding domain-containing protein [Bacillus sp. (in: firmicutes)]
MSQFIEKNIFSILLVGIIFVFSVVFINKYSIEQFDQYVEIKVEKGDTLWGIAQQYKQEMEISKFIAHLEDVNNLNGDVLKAGDVLLIPVMDTGETHLTMDQ